ncbi:MAG: UDP-N-acetylmuramate--L-alanine ligase [Candidatus Nanopelagicaceae bacterium]|nr:UDP-N-acetylmuramate--L-alanine ligase [Candidatus Nanopelagicaceae bacterium]
MLNEPVHFIGIGGAGMSAIARILLDRGVQVSGSDAKDSIVIASLRTLGAKVEIGHHGDNISLAKTVVVSAAIKVSNPELKAALESGIPVLSRAQSLSELMKGYRSVAVAGTHGKTTTTSMLAVAIQECGVDPSFAIGGTPNDSNSNSHHGTGDIFIAEADESDSSFLVYNPYGAIITNVEIDHVDHFSSKEQLHETFFDFVKSINEFLVICIDDAGGSEIANSVKKLPLNLITYGESENSQVRISHISTFATGSFFRITWQGVVLGEVSLNIPGRHNVLNAAAALAAGLALGLNPNQLILGLSKFQGVRRRFELKGNVRDIRVFDDYAHHPTEVSATIATAREVVEDGKIIVIFQPHRYSRTLAFTEGFASSLSDADQVILLDIYGAGEESIPGASSSVIAEKIRALGTKVDFEPSIVTAIELAVSPAKANDLIITMGAGDVTSLGMQILTRLAEAANSDES